MENQALTAQIVTLAGFGLTVHDIAAYLDQSNAFVFAVLDEHGAVPKARGPFFSELGYTEAVRCFVALGMSVEDAAWTVGLKPKHVRTMLRRRPRHLSPQDLEA